MVIKLWTDARSRKNSVQPISCTEKGALKLREKRILNVTLFGSMYVWDLLHLRSWASHLHQYMYVYLCVHVRVKESTVNAIHYITCFGKIFTKIPASNELLLFLWWMRTADFSTMMSSNKAHFYDTKFIFESHNTGKEDWLINNYF